MRGPVRVASESFTGLPGEFFGDKPRGVLDVLDQPSLLQRNRTLFRRGILSRDARQIDAEIPDNPIPFGDPDNPSFITHRIALFRVEEKEKPTAELPWKWLGDRLKIFDDPSREP